MINTLQSNATNFPARMSGMTSAIQRCEFVEYFERFFNKLDSRASISTRYTFPNFEVSFSPELYIDPSQINSLWWLSLPQPTAQFAHIRNVSIATVTLDVFYLSNLSAVAIDWTYFSQSPNELAVNALSDQGISLICDNMMSLPLWYNTEEGRLDSTSHSEYSLDYVSCLFEISDQESVLSFLEEHTFLVPLLEEAPNRIREYFPDAPLILAIDKDPEGADEDQMVLGILTELAPKEARPKLKQLDQDWWLYALERAKNKLYITLEYV